MTTWKRVTGDAKDKLIVQLGGIEDLDAAVSMKGIIWHPDTPPGDEDELDASVYDAPNLLVAIDLGSWITTAAPAKYHVRTRVTFAGGIVLSWPDGWPDTLEINR